MKINQMLLIVVSLAFSNFVCAEYTIKIPLELAHGGTLPNGSINPYKPPVAPPVAPETPANGILYTSTFLKSSMVGSARYNADGVLYDDSRGLMMFVKAEKLVGGKEYSMFYNDKLSCVVSTWSCIWGVPSSEGGCAVTDSRVSNGPKIRISRKSGNCNFDNDYVVKIKEIK